MHMNADTWNAFGASTYDHIIKTQARASGSGSGAGGSASKRPHPDPDSRDDSDGPSSSKKQRKSSSKQAYGSSYNPQGTRSSRSRKPELKKKPHV